MDKKIDVIYSDDTKHTITDKEVISTFRFARYGVEFNQGKVHTIIPFTSIKRIEKEMM